MQRSLDARDLRVGYGATIILHSVTFSVQAGKAGLLTGSNGSGKTSLLRTILGLQPRLGGALENAFRRLGYVPQARSVDRTFPVSVERTLEMSFAGPRFAFLPGARRRMSEAIERALQTVSLADRRTQLLRECSGGELQKALIARALVHEPDLLVLDEPTNSVDADGRTELLQVLRNLRDAGTAILMTTHEKGFGAADVFDYELHIHRGVLQRVEREAVHA